MNNVDTIAYASDFTGNLSLWLAILIGIIASILVLRAAKRMGGGLFGAVLNLIGIGMFLAVVGTIFIALPPILPATLFKLGYTVFFSTGFICMVLGANKLLKGIMSQ